MSFTSRMVNYTFSKGDKVRDKGLITPKDVTRIDNLSYGADQQWNLLDLYVPKERQGKHSVIISIHGGGWVYGTKEVYQHYCMNLAQRGFAVINFNYRLAPFTRFPAQLEDVNSVVRWVLDHGKYYDLNTDQVFMVGDSAGAHLLALYCSLLTNSDFSTRLNIALEKDFRPKAVALNCGIYDVTKVEKRYVKFFRSIAKDLLGKKGFEKNLEMINGLKYITKDFPPVYLMTSNGDMLANQAPLMEEILIIHGIHYVMKQYGDSKNKLMHVFHLNIKNDHAKSCNDAQCVFFRQFL